MLKSINELLQKVQKHNNFYLIAIFWLIQLHSYGQSRIPAYHNNNCAPSEDHNITCGRSHCDTHVSTLHGTTRSRLHKALVVMDCNIYTLPSSVGRRSGKWKVSQTFYSGLGIALRESYQLVEPVSFMNVKS